MRLNDKERYTIDTKLLEAVYTTKHKETTKEVVKHWAYSYQKTVYTGEVSYKIVIQINKVLHDLTYDSESARNADYESLAKLLDAK